MQALPVCTCDLRNICEDVSAFWLECTRGGERFAFSPAALTMYLINETSHNRINDTDGEKELRIITDYLGSSQTEIIKQ